MQPTGSGRMLIGVLTGLLGGTLLVEVWLVVLLRRAGVWARPVVGASLSSVESRCTTPNEAIHRRVSAEVDASVESGIGVSLDALRWLVALFPADAGAGDADTGGDAAVGRCSDPQVFPGVRRPHCGEIAQLYRDTLAALGIESRTVWLRKNVFDPNDSHVSVEARVGGRWVLVDPTFHATFADAGGGLLGAQAVKAYLFNGRRNAVVPTVHGRALCPLALDDYYVDVLACFNNVFILDDPPRGALLKLPPLRYVLGPRLFYAKLPDESVSHLRVWRGLYTAAAGVLPCVIAGLALALAVVGAVSGFG